MHYAGALRSLYGSLERPECTLNLTEFSFKCSLRALQVPVFFPEVSVLLAFSRTTRETFIKYAKFPDNPLNGLIFLWHAAKLCVSEIFCSQCARGTRIILGFSVVAFFDCFPCSRPFGAMFPYELVENSMIFGGVSTLWHIFLPLVLKTLVPENSIFVKKKRNPEVGFAIVLRLNEQPLHHVRSQLLNQLSSDHTLPSVRWLLP